MNPIIALWTHPRSISTAFERMMMERGDVKVMHEPFSLLYYVHEKRVQVPYVHDDPAHPHTYPEAKAAILRSAEAGAVFFKDMCYHCFDYLIGDEAFLERLTNTFLIREPIKTIGSHYQINPQVSRDEIGYEQQWRVFNKVQHLTGKRPVVVDADDVETDPAAVVAAYCTAVGLPFLPESLHWEAGHKAEWDTWKEWHADAARSTGFHRELEQIHVDVEAHPQLKAYLEHHRPFYERLYAVRLTGEGA